MKHLFFALLLTPLLCLGQQTPQPKQETYINDHADVISLQRQVDINKQLRALEDAHHVQMAIVLVNKLPEGVAIEDYAREIGRQWHVGTGQNGLVYVAAIDEHKQRLEVPTRLEGSITDVIASGLTDEIKPYFRSQDYAGGIQNMIGHIDQLLSQPAAQQAPPPISQQAGMPASAIFLIVFLCVLAISLVLILISAYQQRRRNRLAAEARKVAGRQSSTLWEDHMADLRRQQTSTANSRIGSRYTHAPSGGTQSSTTVVEEVDDTPMFPRPDPILTAMLMEDNYVPNTMPFSTPDPTPDPVPTSPSYGDWGHSSPSPSYDDNSPSSSSYDSSSSSSSSYDSGSSSSYDSSSSSSDSGSSGFDGGGSSSDW